MKKVLALLLALTLSITTMGCGGKPVDTSGMTLEEKITYETNEIIKPRKDSGFGISNLGVYEVDGENSVNMHIKREMPASEKTLKMDILIQTKDLLEKISEMEEVDSINLVWENEMKDQYGNGEFIPSLRISMSKETLDKINWDDILITSMEDVADDYWQHNSLID